MKNKLACLVMLVAVFTVGCANNSTKNDNNQDESIKQVEEEVKEEAEQEIEQEIQQETQGEGTQDGKSSAELEELLIKKVSQNTIVDIDAHNKEIEDIRNELANAYYNEGSYEKAIEEAVVVSETTKEPFVMYNSTVLIGDCYQQLGEFEKALDKYNEADEIDVDSTLVTYNKAYVLTQKSRAYMELGQFDEAKQNIDKVFYMTDINDVTAIDKIYAYMILASIYYEDGDIESASKTCEEGYMFAIDAEEYDPAISLFMLRAMLHEEVGDYEKAYEVVSDAIIFCNEVLSLGFNQVVYDKQLMLENYKTYLDGLR